MAQKYGVSASVQAADLARPGAAADLQAALQRKSTRVDVLVNCAGVLEQGAFTAMDAASHQGIIDLNISGAHRHAVAFVPGMVEQGQGRVLNVASIAAFQPIPTLATLCGQQGLCAVFVGVFG